MALHLPWLVLLCYLCVVGSLAPYDPAEPSPSLLHFPFLTVWNAPTERCGSLHGVDLDLGVFDIVHNQNQSFRGENITIFYSDQLGLYPHYYNAVAMNGGVPQNASLSRHLQAAGSDIRSRIPDRAFAGLAVMDWEQWRPLWARNWDSKQVYQEGSRALLRAEHPDWSPAQVEEAATREFERSARSFMEETLKLGLAERPGGLWGFYGFPGCYNYQYEKNGTVYTGECPPQEVRRNHELAWLWNTSTALYPNIYLDLSLRGRDRDILLYARHRVLEAVRVREQVASAPPPVFPYARIAYTYSMQFLSEEDLVHTVGESAALGATGVVLWGDGNYSRTKNACEAVRDYLDGLLGRYVVNVTTAAILCSQTMCSAQGRCVRRDPGSSAYLHLDPAAWTILSRAQVSGQDTSVPPFVAQRKEKTVGTEKEIFTEMFQCQCFPGWLGERCEKPLTS